MSNEIMPLSDRMDYAKALAASDLLPEQYRGKPANVLVAVEYGNALGVDPMAAIQGITVIKGKPTLTAQMVGALVRRAGHTLRIITHDKEGSVEAQIVRKDDPEFVFRAVWSMDRAKTANLSGKGAWVTFPLAMLKARAITEVARDACPDVLAGVSYTPEELEPDTAAPPVVTRPTGLDLDTGEIVVDVPAIEGGDDAER